MELLKEFETKGLPADYLLARLRGRKGRFVRNRRTPIYGPGPAALSQNSGGQTLSWDDLMREFRWVYVRMDTGLRRAFGPFFIYAELRTISLCLRFLVGNKEERASGILSYSLLSDGIKKILTAPSDIASAADRLGKILLPLSPDFAGMGAVFRERGLRDTEQLLACAFLQYSAESASFAGLRTFFSGIIDMKNLVALWKGLRWNAADHVSFIKGGRIREGVLNACLKGGDISAATDLILRTAGCEVDWSDITGIETGLLKRITRMLSGDREPLGQGPILNYLWQCLMETSNMGGVLYGGGPAITAEKPG